MKINWSKISNTEKFLAAMQIIMQCQRCGRCCVHMRGIAYNSVDTQRMAKHLDIEKKEFIKNYTRPSGNKPSDRWLNLKGDEECIFWSKDGCTQYHGRGQVCRLYPFTSPEQLEAVRNKKPWHIYAACEGMKVTYKAVLVAAAKMPFDEAKAIIESKLGEYCMLSLIRDTANETAAEYAARDLGLEAIPDQTRLYAIAWNYAVAFMAVSNPIARRNELDYLRDNMNLVEEN